MPQVYLPQNWSAMSADGTITGTDVTLNFNQDGNGRILNTGDISASNTLTVNTGTLTMTGQLSWANAFEAAAVAGITAGLTNGITYDADSGLGGTTQPLPIGGATTSITGLAGVSQVAGTSVNQATATTASLTERGLAMHRGCRHQCWRWHCDRRRKLRKFLREFVDRRIGGIWCQHDR